MCVCGGSTKKKALYILWLQIENFVKIISQIISKKCKIGKSRVGLSTDTTSTRTVNTYTSAFTSALSDSAIILLNTFWTKDKLEKGFQFRVRFERYPTVTQCATPHSIGPNPHT